MSCGSEEGGRAGVRPSHEREMPLCVDRHIPHHEEWLPPPDGQRRGLLLAVFSCASATSPTGMRVGRRQTEITKAHSSVLHPPSPSTRIRPSQRIRPSSFSSASVNTQTHTHTHTRSAEHTDRQTDRHTHTHTHTHIHTQRHTHTPAPTPC
jgi:hypothetical protein